MPQPVPSGLVHRLLADAAADCPHAIAVQDARGAWTYRQVAELADLIARRLAGLGHGERVVAMLPNRREAVPLWFGCARAGAILVPVHPGTKSYRLSAILGDAEPALVLVEDDQVATVRALTSARVLGLTEFWRELDAEHGELPAEPAPGDVVTLIYTTGSTGTAKAVVCPHAPTVFAARAISGVLGYRPEDVVYCAVPLAFDYGLYQILLATIARAELVLAPGEDSLRLLRGVRATGATVVPLVPSLARTLIALAVRTPGPSAVRLFTNTGETLPPAVTGQLRTHFPGARVALMFGTTECKRISVQEPDADLTKPGALGKPLPGTEVTIVDAGGAALPAGQTGEIVVAGRHVMAGYWRAPELTSVTFRPDGPGGALRLHTGDHGWLDEDGQLYFAGRRDSLFKRRGVRTSTAEIEAAALDVPGVTAAVVLAPDDDRDLTICAVTGLGPDEVLSALAERLESEKVPSVCQVLADLPLTPNGKAARRQVARQIAVEER